MGPKRRVSFAAWVTSLTYPTFRTPTSTHTGTEITINVESTDPARTISRQTALAEMRTPFDSKVEAFLRLPEVAASLAREVGLTYAPVGAPATEQPLSTFTCNGGDLRPSPAAWHCCEDSRTTMFIRGDGTGRLADRGFKNGWRCKTSTGGTCSGTACIYGPCGGTTASINSPPPGTSFHIRDNAGWCFAATSGSDGPYGNPGGTCGYTGCLNGTPVTGGAGSASGYWEY